MWKNTMRVLHMWTVSSFHLFAVAAGGSRGGRRKGGGLGETRRGKNSKEGELGV